MLGLYEHLVGRLIYPQEPSMSLAHRAQDEVAVDKDAEGVRECKDRVSPA
jgi:hypothetical protein